MFSINNNMLLVEVVVLNIINRILINYLITDSAAFDICV